ncbi:hypothetical protein [Comamonas testosteroni]|uniref:Uncharacterized protein n=1 Tax=Comamonas testosteroni TaxID=285 RepID=A0A8B4S9L2_COMTE|nr:hypothetical protein [Comamonas testosteroni]EHN64279.1 hypothetical protein CTATCC11996_18657 [Comamonas testosteroni ATCC 11996]QQN67798.1 hypothetical protein IYN88_13215 [Comamonas testosteroni]SUY79015.1 Uncharacterised protein [Comamonas testosteroni]
MEYEIGKTFKSGDKLLKPGDPLPAAMDKITLDHYKRHGMVREVKPQESKPDASKRRTTTPRQKEIKSAGPGDSNQSAGQSDLSAGNEQVRSGSDGQADGTVHTSAQEPGDSSAAAPASDSSAAQPEA